ncbi:MAG: hypothetical protein WD847_09750 [Pirellulales bacterium]
MSEVRLVVREAACDWSGTMHGSRADRAIAALSADPVTLEELEDATARFARPMPNGRFFANLRPGLCDEPYDAGLVVVDLVARLVVVDSTYSSPGKEGTVEYHNGRCCTRTGLGYHLADDWLFSSDGNHWKHVAEERRRERAARPAVDARAVFYGRPLVEFVARETFAAFARRDEIAAAVRVQWTDKARKRLADEANLSPDQVDAGGLTEEEITPKTWPGQERYASPFYDALSQIHAAWLLSPRDDLGGDCPRAIALGRHEHLMWDLQDRCEHWSLLGECPRGLAESSHAFRHGGFGTHELVKYYDLVRESLWSCWEQLSELARSPKLGPRPDSFTAGDFLTMEVPRLESIREAWLDAPDPECHGRTPRSIIERERARLPEGMSGHDAMIDPDCPCCQMMADLPGPGFWHLDGSGMDDDFAFDIYRRTREEWEEERRGWEERSRRFDAEWSERKRLGVTDSTPREDGSNAVWSRSFCVGDTADVPLGTRVFGLGCRLAELIVGLRAGADRESTPAETQRQIDQLNRDFGNLRELLQGSDLSLAEALIDPVLDRFAETLATVATARPELAGQCESLTSDLHKLPDPPPPEPNWDPHDGDLPL